MKNAEIEANGDETQTAEPQEDKAHDPILGAKNEANCEMKILLATDETRIEHG